jgi:hypothetical protein
MCGARVRDRRYNPYGFQGCDNCFRIARDQVFNNYLNPVTAEPALIEPESITPDASPETPYVPELSLISEQPALLTPLIPSIPLRSTQIVPTATSAFVILPSAFVNNMLKTTTETQIMATRLMMENKQLHVIVSMFMNAQNTRNGEKM